LDLGKAQAAGDPQERESLRGLSGLGVVIGEINPDAQADGLSQEAIRTAVELILRSSGIQVLTQPELLKPPVRPYLYVQITTINSGSLYSVGLNEILYQEVSL